MFNGLFNGPLLLWAKRIYTNGARKKKGFQMLPHIMKWISSATLALDDHVLGLCRELSTAIQSPGLYGQRHHRSAASGGNTGIPLGSGFVAIVLVFNAAAPLFRASGDWFRLLAFICIAVFAVSLTALKTRPVLAIAPVTGRNPGSESL